MRKGSKREKREKIFGAKMLFCLVMESALPLAVAGVVLRVTESGYLAGHGAVIGRSQTPLPFIYFLTCETSE